MKNYGAREYEGRKKVEKKHIFHFEKFEITSLY